MPDIPQAAVAAAAQAIADEYAAADGNRRAEWSRDLAILALAAAEEAWPHDTTKEEPGA